MRGAADARGGRGVRVQRILRGLALLLAGALMTNDGAAQAPVMTSKDLLALPQPPPDHRLAYGRAPQQFADLRLPAGPGPHPVLVFLHGGCWMAEYDLSHTNSLMAALAGAGIATWSVEYRRLGHPGGGWPGTFEDVAAGIEALADAAGAFNLDRRRVAAAGHSAGGHLALWLAARDRTLGREADPSRVRVNGVVALAPITDLAGARASRVCGDAPAKLAGEDAETVDRRASPVRLLPFAIPQWVLHGERDSIVPPEMSRQYGAVARQAGDAVNVQVLHDTGHFELVNPRSTAWPAVLAAVRQALEPGGGSPPR
jgi:acetyl esterase/lipase